MKFDIKRILTNHFIVRNKDFALCEFEFTKEADDKYFDEDFFDKHRYGTVEYGKKVNTLLDVCAAPSVAEAIQMRIDAEDIAKKLSECGDDPLNGKFISWMKKRICKENKE